MDGWGLVAAAPRFVLRGELKSIQVSYSEKRVAE